MIMRITELLTKETIHLSLTSATKTDTIEEMVSVLDVAGRLNDRDEFKQAIINREAQSTTGVGDGIAIPHAKTDAVKHASIAFGRSIAGVDYEALDGQPSHLFFMIAATEGADNLHLQTLARLSTILLKEEVRQQLMEAETADDVLHIINEHDQEDEEENAEDQSMTGEEQFIVAVTACPTGIAHTYMSADALRAQAKEMGVQIKVETNGSSGAQNALTADEIDHAVAVIVAADTNVDMDRFDRKHVIEVAVADGIRKPQELIDRALQQDAPIYQGDGKTADQPQSQSGRGVGATIYKHLMSGVSNMLPFVIGGGILIALGFLFGVNASDPNDPSYNAIAEAFNTIGGDNAFALMIPVLAGFIAMSIADRPGFAPGMGGGMMAPTSGSGFLGGIIAGFLGGYVVVGLRKALETLPRSLEGIKTRLLFPLLGIAISGFIMHFVVNNPLGALNIAISDWLTNLGTGNAVLLGLILGLMMSFDMGGPVNKAAYLFGTGLLASGIYEPMAAIMAAGMVPPLAIAIATTFFSNKFSQEDKDAGKVNYIMGLSFITEGAIPFDAKDPLRVISSFMFISSDSVACYIMFVCGASV